MTAPNHVIGGFTITGIVSSIIGINILEQAELIPIIIFASLLPDIDHPKSIIGRIFKPISKLINRKYGHRTITHSLIVLVALVALISGFQSVYFPDIPVATVFGLAYGGHLILDMVTVQGCPLFYPFYKNPCVIPGNPHMRLRTGNMRHETMAFCFFTVSVLFLQPLFANGFWTTYNSLFGTLKHIVSEYHKTENLMIVDFTVQHGSDLSTHRGLCIEVSPTEVTTLTKKKEWQTWPQDGQQIKEISPTHTKMKYSFEQGQFHDITIDSIHSLFRQGKYTHFDIQANQSFYWINNGINTKKKTLKLDYPNSLILQEIPDTTIITKTTNPQIQLKLQDLNMYRTKQKQEMVEYQSAIAEYNTFKAELAATTDEVEKELMMIEFGKMKKPDVPNGYDDRIKRIQLEIRNLRSQDELGYQEKVRDAVNEELGFSGSFERVVIGGKFI